MEAMMTTVNQLIRLISMAGMKGEDEIALRVGERIVPMESCTFHEMNGKTALMFQGGRASVEPSAGADVIRLFQECESLLTMHDRSRAWDSERKALIARLKEAQREIPPGSLYTELRYVPAGVEASERVLRAGANFPVLGYWCYRITVARLGSSPSTKESNL
jgi:hypothetical protein